MLDSKRLKVVEILCIIAIIVSIIGLVTMCTSCGMKSSDTNDKHCTAIISLGNTEIEVEMKSRRSYSYGICVIESTDGKIYTTHMSNVLVIEE